LSTNTRPQWIEDIIRTHPGFEHCQIGLDELVEQGKVSISWNESIVRQCCGASVADEGAYLNSLFREYFQEKGAKIDHDLYYNPDGTRKQHVTTEDINTHTQSLRDLALELVKATHPGLYDLGQRWNVKRLAGDPGEWVEDKKDPRGWRYTKPPTLDFAIGYWFLTTHPEAPLDSTGAPPLGWNGWQGAYAIGRYRFDQQYGAAKGGMIEVELAERWLEQLTPREFARAKVDCERYSTWTSDDPGYGNHLPGSSDARYNINAAHSWGGYMDRKQLVSALAWLTLLEAWPLLGRDEDPKPGDPGWEPLPPLQDPLWQQVGHGHVGGHPTGTRKGND